MLRTAARSYKSQHSCLGGWKQLGQGSDPCAWRTYRTGAALGSSEVSGHSGWWPFHGPCPCHWCHPQRSLLLLPRGVQSEPRSPYSNSTPSPLELACLLNAGIPRPPPWPVQGSLGAPLPKPLIPAFQSLGLSKPNPTVGIVHWVPAISAFGSASPKPLVNPLSSERQVLLPEKREERKDSSKRQTQIEISPDVVPGSLWLPGRGPQLLE